MTKKTTKSKITEEEVTNDALSKAATQEKLKTELDVFIKDFATTYSITFGEVLEILKDMEKNMEMLMLQNVMREIARQEINKG